MDGSFVIIAQENKSFFGCNNFYGVYADSVPESHLYNNVPYLINLAAEGYMTSGYISG